MQHSSRQKPKKGSVSVSKKVMFVQDLPFNLSLFIEAKGFAKAFLEKLGVKGVRISGYQRI